MLKLAKEHRDAKEIERVNRYYIPKDDEKPQDRYVEEDGPKGKLEELICILSNNAAHFCCLKVLFVAHI